MPPTDAEDLEFMIGAKGDALSSDLATVTALANDVSSDVAGGVASARL